MKEIKLNDIPIFQFDIFDNYPKVTNYTSTRIGGKSKNGFAELNIGLHVGDKTEKVLQNRAILASAIGFQPEDFTCGQQVHGAEVRFVSEKEKGRGALQWVDGFENTDAMITNAKRIPLMVVTADCAAVSIYDPVTNSIGLVHAGKKGTTNGIVSKTIRKMSEEFGTDGNNLIVGIGPSIHACCYELDIPSLIKDQLLLSGVKEKNMEFASDCTFRRNDIFYSYRKENGKTGRFGNILFLS